MKRVLSILLTLTLVMGIFSVPLPPVAESVIKKTMRQFEQRNLSFETEEGESYKCKVTNNGKGYIKVDSENCNGYFYLMVKSQKLTTGKKKPRVILINNKDNSVDKNGVCHCIAKDPKGINRVNYTITFKDGS